MAVRATQQGILRKTVALTGNQDPICPNSIFLDGDKTTTFGRTSSSETNVRLLSSKTPLMISRKHASIAFENGIWTILDHKSLNGVYVNGDKIPPSLPYEIKPGDCICFGVAIENNVHEFDYTFEVTRKRKLDASCEMLHDKERKLRKVLPLGESVENRKNEAGPSGENAVDDRREKITACIMIQESEKKIEELRLLLAEKDRAYEKQIEEKEKDLAGQLLQQKGDLECEKKEQEKCLMLLLEDKLREKESELSNQLEQQKTILLAEKETVENDLLLKLNSKLEEKDKELTTQLEAQRDRLQNIVQSKVDEQMRLQEELGRNKVEREKVLGLQQNEKKLAESLEKLRCELVEKQDLLAKQQDITRKAEEMAKKILVEQMEDEFTCIICHELFIQATTLACSHSFCDYCLRSWLKKQKSCPICRTHTMNGTFVRSIVLDSAVSKIAETMDDETKKRRRDISEERKELIKQEATIIKDNVQRADAGNQANPIVVATGHVDNEVQIVERQLAVFPGVRVPFPRFAGVAAPPVPPPGQGIRRHRGRVPDGNHGNQHRARHGNGHCYVCGMRGHWARTCPFR